MADGVLLHFENGLIKVSRKSGFKAEATFIMLFLLKSFLLLPVDTGNNLLRCFVHLALLTRKKQKTCCPPLRKMAIKERRVRNTRQTDS